MVLVLLLSLAFLLWLIQAEFYPVDNEAQLPAGFCPVCQAATDIDWIICPHCQSRLKKSCGSCHKSKLINQAYCPYCGDEEETRAV